MSHYPKNHLTQGAVTQKLMSLTFPMILGMLSMVVFNLVDTFFVSRLGTKQLAAIGFTFPVVMFLGGIALGFGVATASLVSRAIGRGDEHQVKRLATDSLIISVLVVIVFTVIGLLTMDWMFGLLGAQGETLVFIKDYMMIWYCGAVFVVIPMVGNNAMRACGDTLIPGLIMMFSMVVNVILDPLMIFGLVGFPKMGLKGAALATVIARAAAMVCSLLVLYFKKRLIEFGLPSAKEFTGSVKQILYIGIPTAVSRLLMPVTMAIIMRLVAGFGAPAVAAIGVALKIEMFVFVLIMALATALIPFVGQNWGAKKIDRVKEAVQKSNLFSIWWGTGMAVVFFILAVPFGHVFGKELEVQQNISLYLCIIPISYGLRGCAFLIASVFNAINRPLLATALDSVRMFLLYIPFALIGSHLAGLTGLFVGLCLANICAGGIAIAVEQRLFK